ncbi:MAG: DinB family protein [bacterium]
MTDPDPSPPDTKDWTWVLGAPCPACGFDAAAVAAPQVATLVEDSATRLAGALARPDAARRPAPQVWSALEYGCHVRDVCRMMDRRLRLMLTDDNPEFANWDQDRTAVEDRYWSQDPAVVAAELLVAAADAATTLRGVAGDEWSRPGRRSNGSVFTVDSLARYFAHDVVHHAADVGA